MHHKSSYFEIFELKNSNLNVKFSKGPGAISEHKSEDREKSLGRIQKP